ncbi:MAG: CubicO group peptidase (beta-lactamase class C family) [Arenicella sp.]|jgi:CubicO group peptidase (beta-lactamase class C family)
MLSRFLTFFFIFTLLILQSCKGDQVDEIVETVVEAPNQWTDSIFGSLSEKEQYYQHLIFEVPSSYQLNLDSLTSWVVENQPGALKFDNWHPDSISFLKNACGTFEIIQPIFYTNVFEILELDENEYWDMAPENREFSMLKVFSKGQFGLLDFSNQIDINKENLLWMDSVQNKLGVNIIPKTYNDQNAVKEMDGFLNFLKNSNQSTNLTLTQFDSVNLNNYRKMSDYEGLFVVSTKESNINAQISGGADYVFKSIKKKDNFSSWDPSKVDENFKESTKRILDHKSIISKQNKRQHLEAEITYTKLNLAHNSVSLLKDQSSLIPLTSKFTIYSEQKLSINQKVRKENKLSVQQSSLTLKKLKAISSSQVAVILLPNSATKESLEYLAGLKVKDKKLVCFSNPAQYESLKETANLMFVPLYENFNGQIFAQQLTSRIDINGSFKSKGNSVEGERFSANRLARCVSEFVGYDHDTLSQINWAVNNAMSGRAFPGCQVLIAKNGCIIYDRQFGHHSYKRQKVVTDESIYDLASLTKVVATTMVGMKLYEMGAYNLQDSLGKFLPDSLKDYLPFPSTIRNITFEELFIHKSGMPAGFPIIKYMQYTSENVGRLDKYFCDLPDSSFNIEVAENFYLEKEYGDSMWLKLNQIWLNNAKPYKYSDVNMNTLYMMFKGIIQKNPINYGFNQSKKELAEKDLFVEYLYNSYYIPLGMERSLYKPRNKYNVNGIVPTEDETWWRKQLLQGHVHDPNAALMGGVGGNAGMFSTTNDLAKLCQMLLNKGYYHNERYLKSETVEKFTSAQPTSSRGLGFNKRTITTTGYGMADSSSILTYGHTGFTGTCFWVDPDEDLVYIFLSNRVHPKVNNRIYQYGIRKRIHNTAYSSRLNN